MNRIDRLFGILTLLQSKKNMPAETIAHKFKISIRTVYRDIKAIGEQGVPVSFEQGKGYFIVQGYFLPPISFTTEEANALLLMEKVIHGFTDKSIHKHYSTAVSKISAVLRHTQKENVEKMQASTQFQLPSRFIEQSHEYLSAIQQAVTAQHILHLQYKNTKDELSQRKIEPIGIIFYAFGWHLIGWCHLRKEYRDFKIERIKKLTNNNEAFTISSHIPIADYMKQLPVNY